MNPEEALREALDPTTPAARLPLLVGISPAVDQALAVHPAAGGELLWSLWFRRVPAEVHARIAAHPAIERSGKHQLHDRAALEHPAQFLRNPALPLWLLEDPNYWEHLSSPALCALLTHPNAPAGLRQWAIRAGGKHEQIALVLSSSLSADEIDVLLRRGDPASQSILFACGCLSLAQQQALLSAAPYVRDLILRFPRTPVPVLQEAMRQHEAWELVAAHPSTPTDSLRWLEARVLAPSENARRERVWAALAGNPSAPEDLLRGLLVRVLPLQERSPTRQIVWEALAKNPSTPLDLLEWLARQPAVFAVYAALCANPRTPPAVLAWLGASQKGSVRALVARHPNTPEETLQGLAQDRSAPVREAVFARPGASPAVLWAAAQAEGEAPATVAEVLAQLAVHPDESWRVRVVTHPDTSLALLRQLGRDSLPVVYRLAQREYFARQVPAQVPPPREAVLLLQALQRYCWSSDVLRPLLAMLPEQMHTMVGQISTYDMVEIPGLSEDVWWQLWRSCPDEHDVLVCPSCPAALLRVLSLHKDARIRGRARLLLRASAG